MNKSQLLYNLTSEFESNKENLDLKRHYTAETLDNKYIHFKEHKVELPIKDVSESVAADICIVDNGGNKYIVDGNSYSVDLFPTEQYTPIGVVVVPSSHTDDGTARIISLASMDYNNPDNGNTDGNISIYWGGCRYDVPDLLNLGYTPSIGNSPSELIGEQKIKEWLPINRIYKSSDYYDNEYRNPYDTATCYGNNKACAPSPYLNDGSKNPIYYNTENTGNILVDMDGKSNTEKILAVDKSSSTDWQTATTITNTDYTEAIHPAAQCCWRYYTVGTNKGDWYLPSAGELGYLIARWKLIHMSLDKLIMSGIKALKTPIGSGLWSSTEVSTSFAVRLSINTDYSMTSLGDKDNAIYTNFYVRAFLKV